MAGHPADCSKQEKGEDFTKGTRQYQQTAEVRED